MRKAASRKRLHAILVVAVLVCIFPRNVPGQCRSLRTFSLPAGVAGVSGGGGFYGDGIPDIASLEAAFDSSRGRVEVFSGRSGAVIRTFEGEARRDNFGHSIAVLPDLNGDHIAELLVSAPGHSSNGFTENGRVYVFSGAAGALLFPPKDGERDLESYGTAVAPAGDFDSDGTPDFIVGTDTHSPPGLPQAGGISVFSGRDGHEVFHRDGTTSFGFFGAAVGAVGDFNGDHVDDIFVDEPSSQPGNAHAYVFSGGSGQLLAQIDGPNDHRTFGSPIAGIGDFNGDGLADVMLTDLVGAKFDLFLGRKGSGTVLTFAGADIVVQGVQGFAAPIGDLDKDGLADFVVSGTPSPGSGSAPGYYAFNGRREGPFPLVLTTADAHSSCLGDAFPPAPVWPAGDTDGNGVPEAIVNVTCGGVVCFRVFEFGAMEMRDIQNPAWMDSQFRITTDQNILARGGQSRIGVAADGVTTLLLRIHTETLSSVRFSLSTPHDLGDIGLGRLLPLVTVGTPGTTLTVPAVNTNDGPMAFVLYQAPLDFERLDKPDDKSLATRLVRISCQVEGAAGPEGKVQADPVILRPPVVLCHGLWSSSDAWKWPTLLSDPRWAEGNFKIDYRMTHAAALQVNAPVVRTGIDSARAAFHAAGIACAQVDFIGHSTGGVLGRVQAASPGYLRLDNEGQGDYHKYIALDSPFLGSPVAAWAAKVRAILQRPLPGLRVAYVRIVIAVKAGLGFGNERILDFLGPALVDLSPGSAALSGLVGIAAPSHTHVGTGGSDLFLQNHSDYKLASKSDDKARLLCIDLYITSHDGGDPFPGIVNDGVVSSESQSGGLVGQAVSTSSFLDGLHTVVTSSTTVEATVRELLLAPVNSPQFAPRLPANPVVAAFKQSQSGAVGGDEAPSTTLHFVGTLPSFTSPAPGTSVEPDTRVAFQLGGGGPPLSDLLVFTQGTIEPVDPAARSGSILIPEGVDEVELNAIGFTSDNGLVDAPTIRLHVLRYSSPPDSLRLTVSSRVLEKRGELEETTVEGHFGAAGWRDVSNAASGTTLTSSDPTVLAVLSGRESHALGQGVSVLTARNGSVLDTASIECRAAGTVNNPPRPNAGGPYFVCAGARLCLDGSKSTDPDHIFGDQLSFAWDLNGDGNFANVQGPTPCVDRSEEHTSVATLRTIDAHGDPAYDFAPGECTRQPTRPPDCSAAAAKPSKLSARDGHLVPVKIVGITDPDGDSLSIRILSARSNQKLRCRDGKDLCVDTTRKDGLILLSASHSGPGRRREYVVTFEANDSQGGACIDSVRVCVSNGEHSRDDPCGSEAARFVLPSCIGRDNDDPDDDDVVESLDGAATLNYVRILSSNPTRGPILLALGLDAPAAARVELVDVAGRLIDARDLGVVGPGEHIAFLGRPGLPAGLYLVRVISDQTVTTRKVLILR